VAGEDPQEPFKRGPKGGKKHTPGRGHDRKSRQRKKKRFAKKAQRNRELARKEAEEAWKLWDSLPDDVKRFRTELKPKMPRPTDAPESPHDTT
jgi:hypothetical protein